MQHGKQCAAESLKKNPAKLITLMNACSNSAKATISLENRRLRKQACNLTEAQADPSPSEPSRTPKILS